MYILDVFAYSFNTISNIFIQSQECGQVVDLFASNITRKEHDYNKSYKN